MVRMSGHHHRRNNSEEIDVFQAAKYFSGTNEIYPESDTTPEVSNLRPSGHAGISSDMSSMGKATQTMRVVKEITTTKEKIHRQPPASPGGGGRIAKILNAIFNQASLKKGKPIKEETNGGKAQSRPEENPSIFGKVRYTSTGGDWRRKRRSSISNFEFKLQPAEALNSGFRTPPAAYPHTPKASSSSFKDFRSYSEHKDISPYIFKTHLNHNPPQLSQSEFNKFSEADAGADSDSSSDLFDLPNCNHNIYSGELPVYESTHIQRIELST